MENEYTALTGLMAPNTTVFGYRRGDPVSAAVVENWHLVVGEDVVEGDLDDDQVPESQKLQRPDEGDNRATWETWAVAQGMTPEEAAAASQDELEAAGPAEGSSSPTPPGADRPADGAVKAEWVRYAKKLGADEAWADDPATTKAQLQAYQPGDTVAVAATEANAGN